MQDKSKGKALRIAATAVGVVPMIAGAIVANPLILAAGFTAAAVGAAMATEQTQPQDIDMTQYVLVEGNK